MSSADLLDFEFPLENPVPMLPADELFSGGKLLPLHLPTLPTQTEQSQPHISPPNISFSPKAPGCTTRWRDLLTFKKPVSKILHKPSNLDHEDLPRLSLDSETMQNPLRARIMRPPAVAGERFPARVGRKTAVSPRMDHSGKIIFQGLERSCSSPGSVNGGRPRAKCRGMERSFSAHVRVPSVLNVPVCSVRGSSKAVGVLGFGNLFSRNGGKKEVTEKVTEGVRTRKQSRGV